MPNPTGPPPPNTPPKPVGVQRTLRVLASTQNGAATAVLLRALESRVAAVRIGAGLALAARPDAESHKQLLLALDGKPIDVRRALCTEKAAARLRGPAAAAIAGDDPHLCKQACRYAVDADDHQLLPDIVTAATHAGHPAAAELGAAAKRLAGALAAALASRDTQNRLGAASTLGARRAALPCLGRALERFAQHKRRELVDALLLIADHKTPPLRAVFRDKGHPARDAVLDALLHSPGAAAMDTLIYAIEDERPAAGLPEAAARRCDLPYVRRLLGRVGPRPGLRVRTNARSLDGFAWASEGRRERLLELPGREQAAAVRLFHAAGTSREERSALAMMILRDGVGEGRVAACEAMRRVRGPEAEALLREAIHDPCPEVVAAAAGQVRAHGVENALVELVHLLDHHSPVVVAAAQRALGDFSLEAYTEAYNALTPTQRAAAGKLVGRADPDAVETLARGISSPAPGKRVEALRMITDLDLVDRLLTRVLHASRDADVAVRAQAATALGAAGGERVLDALQAMLQDGSSGVRQAADASLTRLGRPLAATPDEDASPQALGPAAQAASEGIA